MSIFCLVQCCNKGIVILVNKWDLVEKEINIVCDYEKELCSWIVLFFDVFVFFIFVLDKQWIFQVVEVGLEVYENCSWKIKIFIFNEVMLEAIECYLLFFYCGCFVKIKYVIQLFIYYLVFVFFCNNFKYVKDNYWYYLENQFCKQFNFFGVFIGVFFCKKQ